MLGPLIAAAVATAPLGVGLWVFGQQADPMTDAVTLATMLPDTNGEGVLSIVCGGARRPSLSLRLISTGPVRAKHSEVQVQLRYDTDPALTDVWNVDSEDVLYVGKQSHLRAVMAELFKSQRLRVRIELANGEVADHEFALAGTQAAFDRISAVCPVEG